MGDTKKYDVLQVPRIELEMKADIPAYAVESFNVKSAGGVFKAYSPVLTFIPF